jgi:sec-independent protein translocase protein TatA
MHLPFAFIQGLGGTELLIILLIALLLFGGKKLPELARGLGKAISEFKKAATDVEDEVKKSIDTAPMESKPTKKDVPSDN